MAASLICVEDYRRAAEHCMHPHVLGYVNGGADGEGTVQENNTAFRDFWLRPRILRDVSKRDLSVTLLGQQVSFPVGVSPSGMHALIHEDGEIGTATAAKQHGVCFILSNWTNSTIEEVSEATPNSLKWFQLTGIPSDRQSTADLVMRAEHCGYKAIVFGVDAPVLGRRHATIRNPAKLPPHLKLPHIAGTSAGKEVDTKILNANITWKDISWLKRVTTLPIILKGILTREDAILAVEHGVDAIIVSNKGGRQLDTAVPTIHALIEIVAAVGDDLEVYLDSGVRCGTDILKALALGARAVFVGRPVLWGLAVGGTVGAARVLEILRDELDIAMALSGCKNLAEINTDLTVKKSSYLSKL